MSLCLTVQGTITLKTGIVDRVDYEAGDKVATVTISGFTVTDQGKLIGPAGVPMDTESFLASLKITADVDLVAPSPFESETIIAGQSIPFNVKTQVYGKPIVSKDGKLILNVDLTYPGQNGYQPFSASTTPNFSYEYRVYSDLEEDSEMAEVTFGLDDVTVSVETRKMRSQWTPELAQDVCFP